MEVSDQLQAPAALPPGKRLPLYVHWTGDWKVSRVNRNTVGQREILHCQNRTRAFQPVAFRYVN